MPYCTSKDPQPLAKKASLAFPANEQQKARQLYLDAYTTSYRHFQEYITQVIANGTLQAVMDEPDHLRNLDLLRMFNIHL